MASPFRIDYEDPFVDVWQWRPIDVSQPQRGTPERNRQFVMDEAVAAGCHAVAI
jgi:hypothetical protein